MTLQDFEALKDFILEKNPYFQKGFANAFKENVTSTVLARQLSGDLLIVSPQDSYGNYFYIRNDEGIIHEPKTGAMTYGAGHTSYMDTIRVNIVGIMKEGEPLLVVDNIINTVSMYKPNGDGTLLRLVSSNWNREQIIISELSGMEKNDIAGALQRLGSHLVFRVTCLFSKYRTPTSCINDICLPCEITNT